jgi:hypothetical protein
MEANSHTQVTRVLQVWQKHAHSQAMYSTESHCTAFKAAWRWRLTGRKDTGQPWVKFFLPKFRSERLAFVVYSELGARWNRRLTFSLVLGSKICRPARRDLRHDGSTFLDADWLWWLGDPSSSPAGVGETNDGPSSAGIDSTSEGKADTKSWFSTPALPGQLSTAGGWGLYFLDKLGVLACGDFWPWVGWGAVITLAVFLSVLILMIVTSICRPIRSFCTCCCRQTKAVAREVGEFLPELQVGGSYGSLDLRGPNTREGVDSNFLSARCDEVDPTSSQIPVKTDQGICDEVGPTSSQIPLGPGFIPFGNYHLIFSCQDPSTECHGKVR